MHQQVRHTNVQYFKLSQVLAAAVVRVHSHHILNIVRSGVSDCSYTRGPVPSCLPVPLVHPIFLPADFRPPPRFPILPGRKVIPIVWQAQLTPSHFVVHAEFVRFSLCPLRKV